ncbi:MAG TPA: bifunctional riboflavin kinase/FAD synthetase [Solirubrobacteraceae bacterium]|nr:bifunctional riboflavin kinase/FAD synthetase [Solirubrobacteraceae bacterium]
MRMTELTDAEPRDRTIAVGTFDGVHVGHRDVIAGADTVLTFEPHPVAVIAPARMPRLLTPLALKADIIASLGVQELIVVRFDAELAAQSPERFISEVLVERLHASAVSVGENFRFGAGAKGDAALLAADGRFATRVVALREIDGEIVSSSQIRSLIAAGEVGRAQTLLGDPFELRGEVVGGDRRGRELGFPTANLVPDPRVVCPGHGVYACTANGVAAAVSIGVRPTFGAGRTELIEAFLLDFDGDLYGQELRVRFLERLRGEMRFDSADALIEEMHRDVERTRAIAAGS